MCKILLLLLLLLLLVMIIRKFLSKQRTDTETGGYGNKRIRGYHTTYINDEIGQNTKKSTGDLRRLGDTHIPVESWCKFSNWFTHSFLALINESMVNLCWGNLNLLKIFILYVKNHWIYVLQDYDHCLLEVSSYNLPFVKYELPFSLYIF